MGIFKAPKSGSPDSEMLVSRLTGVMDLKIFYKGKNIGQFLREDSPSKTHGKYTFKDHDRACRAVLFSTFQLVLY